MPRYEWDAFVTLSTDLGEEDAEEQVRQFLDAISTNPDGPRVGLGDGVPIVTET